MAATDDAQANETPRDIYFKPVVAFFKAFVVFLDVATLMLRLLFNTIVYDSPHGKLEAADGQTRIRD